MRKIFIIIIIVFITITGVSGQLIKVGGGLGFTTGFKFHQQTFDANKSGNFGISFNHIFKLSLPIQIAPSFTYFYPHITKLSDGKTIVSSMMFDLNGQYVFNSLDRFEFYGLAGIDLLLTRKKDSYTGSPSSREIDKVLGLNIGGGTYLKMTEQLDLYGEVKYLVCKYGQLMVNVGVLLNIDWLKKHEKPEI
jgi:hypothetical protein